MPEFEDKKPTDLPPEVVKPIKSFDFSAESFDFGGPLRVSRFKELLGEETHRSISTDIGAVYINKVPAGFSVNVATITGTDISYLVNGKGEEILPPFGRIPARMEFGPPGTITPERSVPVKYDINTILRKAEEASK